MSKVTSDELNLDKKVARAWENALAKAAYEDSIPAPKWFPQEPVNSEMRTYVVYNTRSQGTTTETGAPPKRPSSNASYTNGDGLGLDRVTTAYVMEFAKAYTPEKQLCILWLIFTACYSLVQVFRLAVAYAYGPMVFNNYMLYGLDFTMALFGSESQAKDFGSNIGRLMEYLVSFCLTVTLMAAASALPTHQCFPGFLYIDLYIIGGARIFMVVILRVLSFLLPWLAITLSHIQFPEWLIWSGFVVNCTIMILGIGSMASGEAYDGIDYGIWYFGIPVLAQFVTCMAMIAIHLVLYTCKKTKSTEKQFELLGVKLSPSNVMDAVALPSLNVHWVTLVRFLESLPDYTKFDLVQVGGHLILWSDDLSPATDRALRVLVLDEWPEAAYQEGNGKLEQGKGFSQPKIGVHELSQEQSSRVLARIQSEVTEDNGNPDRSCTALKLVGKVWTVSDAYVAANTVQDPTHYEPTVETMEKNDGIQKD